MGRIVKVYVQLAGLLQAIENCEKSGNVEWKNIHQDNVEQIVRDFLPSGAGWDSGTKLDWESSTSEKLVFCGGFHHMTGDGYYDGWTDHAIIVKPSLASDFSLRITGPDRNDIKDYLYEMFDCALHQEITRAPHGEGPRGFRWVRVTPEGADQDAPAMAERIVKARGQPPYTPMQWQVNHEDPPYHFTAVTEDEAKVISDFVARWQSAGPA